MMRTFLCLWIALTLFQVSLANVAVEDKALKFLTEMTESRVIGGTVAIQKAGELVWSKGFGFASEVSTPSLTELVFLTSANSANLVGTLC